MIQFVSGDILKNEYKADVIVNPVNTKGVMGAGLAKQFKLKYPKMFESYRKFCYAGEFKIGMLHMYRVSPELAVLNFPTKDHWRDDSELEYIELGLKKLASTYQDKGIQSMAFPKLGTGLGGLDWEHQVRPLMIKYLEPIEAQVYIYE